MTRLTAVTTWINLRRIATESERSELLELAERVEEAAQDDTLDLALVGRVAMRLRREAAELEVSP